MRFAGVVVLAGLLAGCTSVLAERQAELTHWIGQPEAQLVGAMGTPLRVYDSGGMRFLTFQDVRVEREPSGPFYAGPGPAAPLGFGGDAVPLVCDTTFTIAGGVVKAFSLRGGGCD